jgi:uncharacterized repeat protein (TIGR04138 family)
MGAMEDKVRRIALEDGRFAPEAYRFLFEGLEYSIHLAGKADAEGLERHVTGREVLRGLEEHGRRLFGPLAPDVWRRWGLRSSLDWGRMVFRLVDRGLLSRQETDTLDDFRGGRDFDEVFRDYKPPLPKTLGG